MLNIYRKTKPGKMLFTALLASLSTFLCLTANAQLTLTATSGTTSASYSTLKQAIDSINNGYHQGDITIKVHTSTTETASITLDSNGRGGVTSYTSVTILPADTATVNKSITGNIAALNLITFQGSDYITIDGRPLGAGSSRFLTFENTGTTAGSSTLSLVNGVSASNFRYITVRCGTLANTASAFNLGTSPATTGNMNINIEYCNITNCRNGINALGTVANPMDNIVVRGNNISNFGQYGSVFSAIKNVIIDSNNVFHTIVAGTAAVVAIYTQADCNGFNATVTRNRVYDLQTAGISTIFSIYCSGALTAPTIMPVMNCFNNTISLTQNSGSASGVYGLYFLGTGPAICRFIHNSVRIGGTHTGGTAGTVVSYAMIKANTAAGSTFVSRNNALLNNRTGGTTGLFHTAFRILATATVGTNDIDFNSYWATGGAGNGPFHATWGNTLYGDPVTYRSAAASVNPNLELNSVFNITNFVSNTDLSLTGASINGLAAMGCLPSPLVTTDITGVARSYPPYKGAYEATPFSAWKDVEVREIYSLGKLPVPYANPHEVRANIKYFGSDTLFGQKVYLQIAGNNSFIDSVTIDTLPAFISRNVSFPTVNYTNLGAGTVTVNVPADSLNTNNSKTFNQVVTTGAYAYADPTLPSVGGVGFNGIGGDFIAKFPYSGSNAINQVGVNFFGGGQPFQVVVYSVVNDTPGVILWNSTTQTSVAGINTVSVSPALPVTGSFFVGVRQTGLVNVNFGYQVENPIRTKTFFYKATSVPSWVDFGSNNSAFRFMVEPRLQVADDIGISAIEQPCAVPLTGGASVAPQFRVNNYGLNPQYNFIVRSQITGPVGMTTADTLVTVLAPGSSMLVTANTLFNPGTPGTYTVKAWTQMAGDLENGNDTATYTFTVTVPAAVNASGNGLLFNGINQYVQAGGTGSLNINGEQLTLEAWVNRNTSLANGYVINKDSSAANAQYSLYINPDGVPIFKLSTGLATDSIVSSDTVLVGAFTHLAATYNGLGMNLYVNGKMVGTKLIFGTITSNVQPVNIGKSGFGTGFFNGTLDEVKIWDTCRTEDQIRTNMHRRLANAPNAHLKAYYRFDEISGAYMIDASGNCNAALGFNTPALVATNFPLGTPNMSHQTATFSGPLSFAGTSVAMSLFNQAGTNDIYVHRFAEPVINISPVVNPGGVTTVYGNYWLMYRYGSGTMDSSETTFSVSGINAGAVNSELNLFVRSNGSSTGWTLAKAMANSINTSLPTVTFGMLPAHFNQQVSIGANNNPLPVTLISFTGSAQRTDALLRWVTSSENNNRGFAVERSFDGKRFSEISFIGGAGNSNRVNTYSYTDKNAFAAHRAAYYRLKQMDLNGDYTYSTVVLIDVNKAGKADVAVYPNPVQKELTIELGAAVATTALVTISDITGKVVKEVTMHLSEGFNKHTINELNTLHSGVYLINITSEGKVLYNDKLVKTE